MPDFRKMTVQRLRDLARKTLGPGHSRLKTKNELVEALEEAERSTKGGAAEPRERRTPAAKAVRAVREAGKAAGERVRSVARAGKEAAGEAANGAREAARRAAGAGKAAKAMAEAVVGAAVGVAGAAAGAAAGIAEAARARRAARGASGGPDPEGYFVARVRGEDAVREAPHPMSEIAAGGAPVLEEPEAEAAGPQDEGLGDLPWSYGTDALVALPRDPRTIFVYWDHAGSTLDSAFSGLDHPRVQIWLFARAGEGWDRLRALEFALESRGYYVHDLEPGRTYRAEIHAVDRAGRDRLVGASSNEVALPPVGPSPIVDDRFIRIPWDLPLGRLLGPGHPGAPFSAEARALLARLSDWSRFARGSGGGSAGGMGGRPTSPAPSSPAGPFGGREE
jgi:hypothetical protein